MFNFIESTFGDNGVFVLAILSLALTVAVAVFFKKWTASKSNTSLFKHDTGLDDVGLNLMAMLGQTKVTKSSRGMTELRPPVGARFLLPIFAALTFFATSFDPFWESLGLSSDKMQMPVTFCVMALLLYTWVMITFVQKITYNQNTITVRGVQLSSETRDLSSLISIKKHEKRPIFVMKFARGKELHAPSFISQRQKFVSDMKAVISKNTQQGIRPSPAASPFKFFRQARTVG